MPERRRLPLPRWFLGALCVVVMANAVITPILWTKIQNSRRESIRSQCVELNMRHDRTLATLEEVFRVRSREVSPALRERLEQSRETTALLIEALVPRRDCEKRVARLTQ